jgi:hypothetical protein
MVCYEESNNHTISNIDYKEPKEHGQGMIYDNTMLGGSEAQHF